VSRLSEVYVCDNTPLVPAMTKLDKRGLERPSPAGMARLVGGVAFLRSHGEVLGIGTPGLDMDTMIALSR
jgi:hypothetical protein